MKTSTYRVTFHVDLPAGATLAEVEAFLRFELGAVSVFRPIISDTFKHTDLASCEVRYVEVNEEQS